MKKIGVVSQKGGVGKSTLARDIARQFAADGYKVKIADLDLKQTTSRDWSVLRLAAGVEPIISVESFQTPLQALQTTGFDLLVFDGKPHSDVETKRIAEVCDLVVIPCGTSLDDLAPQVRLGHELRKAGIEKARIVYVLNGVIETGDQVTADARAYIEEAGYSVIAQAIPLRKSYQSAQNSGRSISEVVHPGLREIALNAVEEIALNLQPGKVSA